MFQKIPKRKVDYCNFCCDTLIWPTLMLSKANIVVMAMAVTICIRESNTVSLSGITATAVLPRSTRSKNIYVVYLWWKSSYSVFLLFLHEKKNNHLENISRQGMHSWILNRILFHIGKFTSPPNENHKYCNAFIIQWRIFPLGNGTFLKLHCIHALKLQFHLA